MTYTMLWEMSLAITLATVAFFSCMVCELLSTQEALKVHSAPNTNVAQFVELCMLSDAIRFCMRPLVYEMYVGKFGCDVE